MSTNNNSTNNITYVKGVSDYTIRDVDDIINVDSSLGAINLHLQNIKNSGLDLYPRIISINDVGGMAATNNITIYATGTDKINGGASVVLNFNSGSVQCNICNNNEWLATGSGIVSSGDTFTDPPFTATAGQTVFNLANKINTLKKIFIDGYLRNELIATTTLSGAKQITLAAGLGEGQQLVVEYI